MSGASVIVGQVLAVHSGNVPVSIPLLEEKEFAFTLELLEEKANPKRS